MWNPLSVRTAPSMSPITETFRPSARFCESSCEPSRGPLVPSDALDVLRPAAQWAGGWILAPCISPDLRGPPMSRTTGKRTVGNLHRQPGSTSKALFRWWRTSDSLRSLSRLGSSYAPNRQCIEQVYPYFRESASFYYSPIRGRNGRIFSSRCWE
jgi:hypothetical protein